MLYLKSPKSTCRPVLCFSMQGNRAREFRLVLSGEVEVFRRSLEGRSLELCRVGSGGICLVSTSS